MSEQDVAEFAKTQLTLPDKIDPADEMSWQHYLYSKLGSKSKTNITVETAENKAKIIDDTVERIVAMSKVLFGLHMVSYAFELSVNRLLPGLLRKSAITMEVSVDIFISLFELQFGSRNNYLSRFFCSNIYCFFFYFDRNDIECKMFLYSCVP